MKLSTPRESFLWLKAIWDHRRNLRSSRQRLEAAHLAKFRRLVALARERSPYYRAIIEQHGLDPGRCVPADFPVLTKKDVIEHFDDIVTDRRITRQRIMDFLARSSDPEEMFEGQFHVLHTSGTSGTVGCFVFSHEAWIKGSCHVLRVSPLRLRQRSAFVGATRGHFAGVSLMLTGNHESNRLFYDVRTFDVGRPLPQIIRELNEFQPHALSAYATMLKVLAEAQKRGELRIRPKRIGSGGEPLLPDTRELIEGAFQVPVMNGYASSEHLFMGMTLPGSDGMHLLEDDLIFEFAKDHTCVTNLFNDVMPLIRYRMDDVLVPDPDSPNPYPFTKVRSIVGRSEDALPFTNQWGREDFIHPIVIVELMIPGLNAWQIVLESKTSFRIRARLDAGLTDAERLAAFERIRRKLKGILAEKEMTNVRFEIEEVEALAIDPASGKFRLVLRQPDGEPKPRKMSHVSHAPASVPEELPVGH